MRLSCFYRAPRTDLTDEDRASLGKSLFTDYISSRDVDEAVAAAQELLVPGFGPVLVQLGVEKAFDALDKAEQSAIVGLIVELAARGTLPSDDVGKGVQMFTLELGDIAMDVPAAPRILGGILGSMAGKDLLGLDVLAAQAAPIEDTEPRRALVAAALLAVKDVAGEDGMTAKVKEAGVDVAKLFEADEEYESHLPSGKAFAAEQGLSGVL